MIRELLMVQVQDPARGPFFLESKVVKGSSGAKKHTCSDGVKRVVYRGSHYIDSKGKSGAHPYAIDYVVMDS